MEKGRILLTGAAGLLGGELAGRLLDRGYGVTALVNRRREIRRNAGTFLPARPWPGTTVGEVALLPGDITVPDLGLDPATADAAAHGHDAIVHCAAAIGFDLDPALYRAVNVDGTAHAVGLARRAGLPFLHVSTAYVWGQRDGHIPEVALTAPLAHANGYEASKGEAEGIVRRSGLPHVIVRPSIVVGEWTSGAVRDFDTFYAVFRLLASGRVRAIPAGAHATLDLVPIDHVVGALVDLVERMEEASGRCFHLVSGAPVTVQRFRDAIAAWPQFHAPELVDPARFDAAALPPRERRLHARMLDPYLSYFRHDPRFNDAETRAFLGRACPPTDDAFLRRLAAYAIEAGFVPA